MLSLSAFRAKYPEFQTGTDPLIQIFLNDASNSIDPSVWGIHEDRGHGLLTAHLLCIAPNGQFARLQSDKNQTTYGAQYAEMVTQVACAIRTF